MSAQTPPLLKKMRHVAEFLLAWCGLKLIRVCPLCVTSALACALADLWYFLDKSRRATARTNIMQSGITDDPKSASRIARHSFRHFALVLVEALKSDDYFSDGRGRERLEIHLAPDVAELMDIPEQGLIVASGHFGNWEIAAQVLSTLKPVTGITRRMNNPYTERLVQKNKPRSRFTLTPKNDANSGRFLDVLKRGDLLAFMIDQHAPHRGMPIDFFGRPASSHTAVALLHLVTGAPLFFGYSRRTGPMRFEFTATPLLDIPRSGDKQQDIRAILERLTQELESVIRRDPEQYLWAHRRWRLSAPGDTR